MTRIAEAAAGARVVFIGESRHDGREHMLFRRLLVEKLVSEHGFNAVALEEPLPEARLLDRCVAGETGDAAEALGRAGNWFIWDTEEMLELVRWLAACNSGREPGEAVRVYGLDITTPGTAVRDVLRFLERADPEAARAATATDLGQDLFDSSDWTATMAGYAALGGARLAGLGESYAGLVALLDANRQRYIAATSPEEYEWARREALCAHEANRLFSTVARGGPEGDSYRAGGLIREAAMAGNLRWVLEREGPGARVVVLAHNVHVGRAPVDVAIPGRPPADSLPSIASLLDGELTRDIYTIGCAFGAWADGPGADTAALDAMLARVGVPAYFLPVNTVPEESKAGRWLAERRTMHAEGGLAECVPSRTWDALFYVDTLRRSTPGRLARERMGMPGTTEKDNEHD